MRLIRVGFSLLLATAFLFGSPYASPAGRAEDVPVYRALLVACDRFKTAPDMTPIGRNNLEMMETILTADPRGFQIVRQYGIISSREALAYAVRTAFAGAKEGDVALVYLSTHGEFDTREANPQGALVLSDGIEEERITARALNELLDEVPGTKVLLVDGCNSGALIGKGVSPDVGAARLLKTFQTDAYKVLTSSGASEPSWYWGSHGADQVPLGGSYFTSALAVGAGFLGTYAADANRDGEITLREMYRYLWAMQASSAVRVFPQEDDFPLFTYARDAQAPRAQGELVGIVFGRTALLSQNPEVSVSYTVTAPTRVVYRLVVREGGQWDWRGEITIPDSREWTGDGEPTGEVTPGRRTVRLDLSEYLPEGWSYALLHIVTPGDPARGQAPFIYAGRVLSAKKAEERVALRLAAAETWTRENRRELEIFIGHGVPCALTLAVVNERGETVRQLLAGVITRPEGLTPEGSLVYWNGLDEAGIPVPPGRYTLKAEASVGTEAEEAAHVLTIY